MIIFFSITIGLLLIGLSALYASSFLAIFGVALAFWAAILFYIKPTKYASLTLLNAVSQTSNIERILVEMGLKSKGVYLPPKIIKDVESSVVFVPKTINTALPSLDDNISNLYEKNGNGVFITPPGLVLSRLFEQEFGSSFMKIDLLQLKKILPMLLIERMELAETVEIQIEVNAIRIKIMSDILNQMYLSSSIQPFTHSQVGCLISSALACVLAKVTGKPIIIQDEVYSTRTKTTTIFYKICEE